MTHKDTSKKPRKIPRSPRRGRDDDFFARLFEILPDAVLIADRDGSIRTVNKRAEVMFGYTRKQLNALGVEDLFRQNSGEIILTTVAISPLTPAPGRWVRE